MAPLPSLSTIRPRAPGWGARVQPVRRRSGPPADRADRTAGGPTPQWVHDGSMSTGAYAAAYEQSISDPTTFWGNAAKAVEWITEPTTVLDDSNPPFYRWFRGGTLNTCFNALDRHVRDGRGDQAALIYDSPVTVHGPDLHVCRAARPGGHVRRCARLARRGEGRPGGRLHADGPRGGRRDARVRPARRHPLGGLRRVRPGRARRPHRGRQAGRHRRRELRHRAEPGRRVQADAGCRARPQRHTPESVDRPPAPAGPRRRRGARHRLGGARLGRAGRRRRARRLRRGRGDRPALRALHLRHDRAGPRASSATTAATPWRCAGRWRTSTTSGRATCGSRHPTSAGSSGTPTSSTRRCSPARPPFSTRASRSARPTRAPSGGSSATTA